MPEWFTALDPTVQKIVLGGAGFVALVLVLRILGGLRERRDSARRRAALQRDHESARLQQEEVRRLAGQILTTSSTTRVIGFNVIRQVEAVFTDGCPSSVAALELAKALAVRKGANAIINLQTQQAPGGKWVACGDAVIVRALSLPTAKPPTRAPGKPGAGAEERGGGRT
jgi:hypothetical protein